MQIDSTRIIDALDLTPIEALSPADEVWIRDLSRACDAGCLALSLSEKRNQDCGPIVYFDADTCRWWAGRYIGEVRFRNVVLRIKPRFGMPVLQHWLSRIWNIRTISSKGEYTKSPFWLWEVLGRLWSDRLISAAKHGLPSIRKDENYVGLASRGRLLVRESALKIASGKNVLVSRTRCKTLDHRICGILIRAYDRLFPELQHLGEPRTWLTDRGQDLMEGMKGRVTNREAYAPDVINGPLRFTPITEGYRSVIQLSLAIIKQRPFSSTASGSNNVMGVLLDMAEIWELYLYQLLQVGLPGWNVFHTGRLQKTQGWLLQNSITKKFLAALKPDILIRENRTQKIAAVVDAKYKSTTPSRDRPHGVLREDIYQMAAYLAAFSRSDARVTGSLVYPLFQDGERIGVLKDGAAWNISTVNNSELYFLGLPIVPDKSVSNAGEEALLNQLRFQLSRTIRL